MWCGVPSLAFVALVGCGGAAEDCADSRDNDGDGYVDCLDQDCSTTCSAIAPREREVCDNAVDDDGDWLIDCVDDGCASVCDTDGDGHVTVAMGGDDCNDGDAAVHPSASEVAYDGVDNDCSADTADDDLDGDGFALADDCNDASTVTFPGAHETCGNGLVDDCDAPATVLTRDTCLASRSAATADGTVLGTTLDQGFGRSVSSAGDANGDGIGDLLVGADGDGLIHTGAAFLVLGPVVGALEAGSVYTKWEGEDVDDWAGGAVAFGGDLDGNGRADDLVIGARYDDGTGNAAGAVYIVHNDRGPGTFGLDDRVAKVFAESEYDSAGAALACPGDVDGDGWDDLLVGSLLHKEGPFPYVGTAHLVRGPIVGDVQLGFAEYKFLGSEPNEQAGCSVAGAGDTNGDGRADLLVGACLYDSGAKADAGAAYHFSDPLPGDQLLFDADGHLEGSGAGDQAGTSVAGVGDTDGDGLDDVLIGAPYNDDGGAAPGERDDGGAAYLVAGPAGIEMAAPLARLYGALAGDQAGGAVSAAGDLDGDGLADIVIGAPHADVGSTDTGVAHVLFGPVAGVVDLASADFAISGAAAFDFAGSALATVADTNADGFDDLLVAAPSHAGVGAAYLFTFGY